MEITLKDLRTHFNYSQDSVARFLGISRQMYIKYENKEVEPSVKVVKALSNLYKVPYEAIIDGVLKEGDVKKNDVTFEIAEPSVAYGAGSESGMGNENRTESYYCDSIIQMFRKIDFSKQLKIFAEIAGIMQNNSERLAEQQAELISGKVETDPLKNLWDMAEKNKWSSNGWKWNREELYDR